MARVMGKPIQKKEHAPAQVKNLGNTSETVVPSFSPLPTRQRTVQTVTQNDTSTGPRRR
jgi:hypothetical protein